MENIDTKLTFFQLGGKLENLSDPKTSPVWNMCFVSYVLAASTDGLDMVAVVVFLNFLGEISR